jgi:signal transduction histidine kinase
MDVPIRRGEERNAGRTHPYATDRFHAAGRRMRAFDSRYPLVWDILLIVLTAAPGVGEITYGSWRDGAPGSPGASVPVDVAWALVAGLTLPLLWRRRRPFAAFCAIFAVLVVQSWLGLELRSVVAVGITLYGVALRLPLSRLAWAAAMILALITGESLYRPPDDFGRTYIPVLALSVAVATLGIAVRTRRDHLASLVERAARLEAEREQKEQLAAAAERSRIAREMHDVIAHNLSVVIGLADGGAYAARTAPETPGRPGEALEAISATGRQALGELRRLLGVLRDGAPQTAELAPQPGLDDMERLLDHVRAAGLPVRRVVHGQPRELSRGRQLTVYRIVQEALTNTLRHGGKGARADVTITFGADAAACADEEPNGDGGLTVEVVDTGAGRSGRPFGSPSGGSSGTPSGGQGILGMRQRAEVYDGTLEVGPLPDGGWRVLVRLPAPPSAPPVPLGHPSDPAGTVAAEGVPR